MKKATIFIFLLLIAGVGHSQIRTPQSPRFPTHQPIQGTGGNGQGYPTQQYQQPNQVHLGATANDISNRQNNQAIHYAVGQKQKEVEQLLNEIRQDQKRFNAIDNNQRVASTEHLKRFDDALQQLQNMLSGKSPLSVADAYYTIENAFGDNYLTKPQYDNTINQSVGFIKDWMKENGLDMKDNYMVHYAIQKFMSEPLTINKVVNIGDKGARVEPTTHQPFRYDYNDYQGQTDYRNLFVTKCLATGFGQCASMPLVYLILAEKLGVKAYLTFAPQHSFVKYPDNSGFIKNYEPTSNWEISDKWYKDNMFISAKAIETGIYLDTLNSKQVVANCLFDLATYYMLIDRTGKEDLIVNCLQAGIPHFPKNNNLPSLFIYSMHLKTMLREVMRKNAITTTEDIGKVPEAKKLYHEYLGNEAYIAKLGYQDMPAGMYEEMLNQHEFKGKIQQEYKVSGKEKRNLFSKITQ